MNYDQEKSEFPTFTYEDKIPTEAKNFSSYVLIYFEIIALFKDYYICDGTFEGYDRDPIKMFD